MSNVKKKTGSPSVISNHQLFLTIELILIMIWIGKVLKF